MEEEDEERGNDGERPVSRGNRGDRCGCVAVAGGTWDPLSLPRCARLQCETSVPALIVSWMTLCELVQPWNDRKNPRFL